MGERTSRGPWPLVAAMLLVAAAGCGGSGATNGPTSTVAPSTSAEPSASAEASPGSGDEPIGFTLLADSGGWGIAERYSAIVSEELGREVRVHNHTVGGQTASDVLQGLRGSWGADVADSEIVVFYVHPGGFTPAGHRICFDAIDAVGGDPDYSGPTWIPGQTWEPPVATTVEDWQGYRDALDQVYKEIWRLRAGQSTILRAYGIWMPWLAEWRQAGIASACTANEEAADEARRQAAEAAGAVYVSMLDVFNGPGHDQDAVPQGWIGEDGMHLSESGQDVLVEALAAVGFQASTPPGTGLTPHPDTLTSP